MPPTVNPTLRMVAPLVTVSTLPAAPFAPTVISPALLTVPPVTTSTLPVDVPVPTVTLLPSRFQVVPPKTVTVLLDELLPMVSPCEATVAFENVTVLKTEPFAPTVSNPAPAALLTIKAAPLVTYNALKRAKLPTVNGPRLVQDEPASVTTTKLLLPPSATPPPTKALLLTRPAPLATVTLLLVPAGPVDPPLVRVPLMIHRDPLPVINTVLESGGVEPFQYCEPTEPAALKTLAALLMISAPN